MLSSSKSYSRKTPSKINSASSNSDFFAISNKQNSSSSRTPRSATSNDSEKNQTIVGIFEGRGTMRGEIGLAALDIKHPVLILCQMNDTHTYRNTLHMINILNPIKILLPETFCHNSDTNKLYEILNNEFPRIKLLKIQRKFFNDELGLQYIQNLCLPDYSSVLLIAQNKLYSLASTAVVIKYIEFEEHIVFSSKSLRINYQGGNGITFIDLDTARKLELVTSQNIVNINSENTLYNILNNCTTFGGQRYLRALILQPPTEEFEINKKLACVQELIENPQLLSSLQCILRDLKDVEQLSWICTHTVQQKDSVNIANIQINYTLLLKATLELIPALQNILCNTKSSFLKFIADSLNDDNYLKILSILKKILNDDFQADKNVSAFHFQRCFAIKTELNEFLDIARVAYSELVQDFNEIVEDLKREYHLPLVVQILKNKGPVLQIKLRKNTKNLDVKKLPSVFIQVHKSQSTITMTTKELLFLKERMNCFIQEIAVLSNGLIFDTLQEIKKYIGCLYKLCENITELDVIVSFALVSRNINFVRPTFSPNCTDLKSSVHPILDRMALSSPTSNNIYASNDRNMCIVTGPNMGGKSIYIRQVALLQIMAQIGCYVPAESAQFRISDQIFCRVGFNDNMESNASSFIVELKEIYYILKSYSATSLIIIDELCRGTSTEEGTAIAWAICEELLASSAFVFITTHFLFLTKLEDMYSNVVNYHFEAIEINLNERQQSHIMFTHKLLPGIVKMNHYGMKLASMTAIPDSILEECENISNKLKSYWKVQ